MISSFRCAITSVCLGIVLFSIPLSAQVTEVSSKSDGPFLQVMQKARKHAQEHGALFTPALSPAGVTVLGPSAMIDVSAMHAAGIKVVPWTVNDPQQMHELIRLRVDGIISDRPDLLQSVVKEERSAAGNSSEAQSYFSVLDVEGHRGGRGLRPENTLPAFEAGLDNLITGIETDTGVTTDRVSLIWHDQFLNPESCRRADGTEYAVQNRVYIQDISITDAQRQFICDKVHFGAEQKNDLALSPVAVAFAKLEGMVSPYAPTYVSQLYRFVRFYTAYYKTGAGKNVPGARSKWMNAERVHFNLETKIMPAMPHRHSDMSERGQEPNHTVDVETFVNTLCGAIKENHMEARSDVQSFDFRTLILIEEKYPDIATYYLTSDPRLLSSELVPEALRVTAIKPTE